MQPKKEALPKKTAALAAAAEPPASSGPAAGPEPKAKPGRPRTSPHDPKTQALLRVRHHRAKLKAAGLEKVEVFLPSAWREHLQSSGQPLQELGVEAFALLLRARGASGLVEAARTPALAAPQE